MLEIISGGDQGGGCLGRGDILSFSGLAGQTSVYFYVSFLESNPLGFQKQQIHGAHGDDRRIFPIHFNKRMNVPEAVMNLGKSWAAKR